MVKPTGILAISIKVDGDINSYNLDMPSEYTWQLIPAPGLNIQTYLLRERLGTSQAILAMLVDEDALAKRSQINPRASAIAMQQVRGKALLVHLGPDSEGEEDIIDLPDCLTHHHIRALFKSL